jgi:hypothetical protein
MSATAFLADRRRAWLAGATLALALAVGGGAQATDHMLVLTGDMSATQRQMFGSNPTFFVANLDLSGFDAFTLAEGDTVEAHVTLTNGPFMVPSHDVELIGLNFFNNAGTDPTNTPTSPSIDGTFSFDGGAQIGAGCGNCVHLITGVSNTALSFQAIEADFTVTTLGAPYGVDRISLSYQLNDNAVPEPAVWTLMLAGFAGAGVMVRRSRREGVSAV